ncbi:MAG: bifunctional 5,10-methylenetetrahydrofolate dehydrogenase/5,10-methenyltetrahydrofolate cyclohydrolase [Coriobacteriales bacterium]|nr:bifunctional 5,10-methylenetetrahydrofolate dehydrogenase/5,10-methenyltetrahydrofolate cyclohydrolase [Coriobacteriales bacterium]
MAQILSGAEVVAALNERTARAAEELKAQGIYPQLAIVRLGKRADEISYERGATKRCEAVGVLVKSFALPEEATQDELLSLIHELNADATVHGVLLLRPLPAHLDDDVVRNALDANKDIDGITDKTSAAVFTSRQGSFVPCTPHACMEILDHFGIKLAGKRAVVVGRSLVVGKPVALMLLDRNTTVTLAHSHTVDLPAVVRDADIVIACVGQAKMLGAEYLRAGQIVIDVGINVDETGALVGDVDFEAALEVVEALTPVPGGVGTVTTSVLAKHVVQAAERA